jgi:hypothetical protein
MHILLKIYNDVEISMVVVLVFCDMLELNLWGNKKVRIKMENNSELTVNFKITPRGCRVATLMYFA